jgi:hypothetical protein
MSAQIKEVDQFGWHFIDIYLEKLQKDTVRSRAHQISPTAEFSDVGPKFDTIGSHAVSEVRQSFNSNADVMVRTMGGTSRLLIVNIDSPPPYFHKDVAGSSEFSVVAHYRSEVVLPPFDRRRRVARENVNVMQIKH